MPFVHMEPPAEGDHISSAEPTCDHRAFVSDDGYLRKPRNLPERNSHRVFDRASKSSQSGPEYDCGCWAACANSLGDDVRRFLSCFCSVRGIHASAPIISSILSDTSSMS